MIPVSVSVIIPTLQAEKLIPELIERLREQTYPIEEIVVIDSSSDDDTAEAAENAGCMVHTIKRKEFDHGGTRNQGARLASGEILVFMTQDALPLDSHFIERLVDPIAAGRAAASMARQVARAGSSPLEKYERLDSYPSVSKHRTLEAAEKREGMGFFFSNASSAVDSAVFERQGGFPEGLIVNEDMLFCARMLRAGYAVAYEADAVAIHSHTYGLWDLFQRYFDIGVSFFQAGDELDPSKLGYRGLSFVAGLMGYLLREGRWLWIPAGILSSAVKYCGFWLGYRYTRLPEKLHWTFSRQKGFWGIHKSV